MNRVEMLRRAAEMLRKISQREYDPERFTALLYSAGQLQKLATKEEREKKARKK